MKIDFHCHSYYSKDGISSPEKLIKTALQKGLDGIALTDHETTAGWKAALETAKKLNATLIFGQEIRIKKGGKTIGEILGYFLKEEINPDGKSIEEIVGEIKKQGGIAIIAHPYYWRKPFHELEKYVNLVDGVECFNSRAHTKRGNEKAWDFARKNNLPVVAGSDAHSCFEVGNAYIETGAGNLEQLKEAILNKKIKIVGKQSSIFFWISPFLGRLRRPFFDHHRF